MQMPPLSYSVGTHSDLFRKTGLSVNAECFGASLQNRQITPSVLLTQSSPILRYFS